MSKEIGSDSAVFVGTLIWPIANERGSLVSPRLAQGYFDFQFYLDSLARYRGSWMGIVEEFAQFYQAPFDTQVIQLISGPIFPLVMEIFSYGPGNFLPLAILYLLVSIGLSAAWLIWL